MCKFNKYLIAIVITMTCTLLYAGDRKVLLRHAISIDGKVNEYVYRLSLEKAVKLPDWETESPPVSLEKALEIARAAYRDKYSNVKFLRLHRIQLNSQAMKGTKRDIWGYFIEFTLMRDNRIDRNNYNMVIVLLDGSVIFHE